MLVTLPDDASRHTVSGRIVWVTPAGSTGRQQGLGIQFNPSETSELLRRRIEELTAGTPVAGTPTHTL
jgi:type IV pilus assembly protein PilZ